MCLKHRIRFPSFFASHMWLSSSRAFLVQSLGRALMSPLAFRFGARPPSPAGRQSFASASGSWIVRHREEGRGTRTPASSRLCRRAWRAAPEGHSAGGALATSPVVCRGAIGLRSSLSLRRRRARCGSSCADAPRGVTHRLRPCDACRCAARCRCHVSWRKT